MRFTITDTVSGQAGTGHRLQHVGDVDRPAQAATVDVWFLHCPGQSPAWSNYVLSCVHLRPIPDTPPPVLKVLLLALDPDRHPQATDGTTWGFLTPYNVVEQVELPDDDAARELLDRVVHGVVSGYLWAEPPLSGQVEPWRTTLRSSAAHLRREHDA